MTADDIEPTRLEAAARGGADAARVAPGAVARRRGRLRPVRRDDLARARRQGRRARGDRQRPPRGRDRARRGDRPGADDGSAATGNAKTSKENGPPFAIIVLSDGASTTGRDPINAAERAKDAGIPVYTVALGTDRDGRDHRRVRPDAHRPGAARQGDAADDRRDDGREDLRGADRGAARSVYEEVATRVGYDERQRELTVAFTAAGGILLLLGAGLSALWFNRIP